MTSSVRAPYNRDMRLKLPVLNRNLLVRVPILLITIIFLLLSFNPASAVCDPWCQLRKNRAYQAELQAKIAELQGQARTLENQIAYMDYQIQLTELEIKETETEIKLLGKDIGDLSQRLERIGSFLEFQEKTFVVRARSAYIADQLSPLDIILGSENLDEAIRRVKYLKVLEAQDRDVLEQMRDIRTEYNEQKATLKDKKASAEELKKKLESQKIALAQQKGSKEVLLTVTRNDERVYQQLLKQAQAEEAAIRALLTTRGGVTCLQPQTVCTSWGCYYNQRDITWCKKSLGDSGLSVGGYGCLVSSVAMIARHYGRSITPADIAATPSLFVPGTGYLYCGTIYVKGVKIDRDCWGPRSWIDGELRAGRPVIVGLSFGHGTAHYVVIKGKNSKGYIMNDPWYAEAHDIQFSGYYSTGQITTVNIVRVY